jgi:hypothetical protein
MAHCNRIFSITALLFAYLVGSADALCASHVVTFKPKSPDGIVQTVMCTDSVDCSFAIKVPPAHTGITSVTADIRFTHKNVTLKFNAGPLVLYEAHSQYVRGVKNVHATLDSSGTIRDSLELFTLPGGSTSLGDSLVWKSRPDYVTTLEITVSPQTEQK